MAITEVTSQGWFSRIGGAIKGVLFGIILFIIGWPVLFLNEIRTVNRIYVINDAEQNAITVPVDAVDAANEGKLVTTTGDSATDEVLNDPLFGVSENAIKLHRNVEMYQWDQDEKKTKKKKVGGSEETVTTYTYKKQWSSTAIDSSRFKETQGHVNPGALPYPSRTQTANNVTLGAFQLTAKMISKIDDSQQFPVSAENSKMVEGGRYYNSGIYVGAEPESPQIGDVRVTFSTVAPGPVSVMAKQVGSSFTEWPTKKKPLEQLLYQGTHNKEQIIAKLRTAEKLTVWLVRLGGFLLMFIGMTLVFKPLSVLADVVPFIGNLVGAGTGIVAFLIAAPCTLIAIAAGWITARPIMGIGLLVLAAGFIVMLFRLKSKKKPAEIPAGA